MRDPVRRGIVAGLTLFLIASTAAQVGLAGLYTRGVDRLESAPRLGDRDIRIFARPVRVAVAQPLPKSGVEAHLRRIGYYEGCPGTPGCYAAGDQWITVWGRYPEFPTVTIRWRDDHIDHLAAEGGGGVDAAMLEPEPILTLAPDASGTAIRTSTESLPYAVLAQTPLVDAIIASEDRWFRTHHGIDVGRLASIPIVGGGASTITMQVARLAVLLDRSRTFDRKLTEIGVAMAIERLYSKEAILTTYLNTVYVGARKGRAIHGFGAAAREFFGLDDIRRLTELQAATLVALLNQPSRYFDEWHGGDDNRLRRQRNRVLRLMRENFPQRYSAAWVRELEDQPVSFSIRDTPTDLLHRRSRHFLAYARPSMPSIPHGRIYSTLDAQLQRIAAGAVESGLSAIERTLPRRSRSRLQAALIAIDPHSGGVLAMIGGRSYEESQFNRTISAKRQIGSIMKPFDYLAALERAAAEGRDDITPAAIVLDRPAVFTVPGFAPWKPANYGRDYAGPITWRRALAESRNVAAVTVASWAGFDRIARLWEAASGDRLGQVFPSIALGAIEATPASVARAYAAFATGGLVRPLTTITHAVVEARTLRAPRVDARRVARDDTTALVADMMRAVLDEGTARGARLGGFTAEAAGKTGTTNGLRDAWFAGFTPNLLTVVWVGRDDGEPLGLTGAAAALPIWTEFMKGAIR